MVEIELDPGDSREEIPRGITYIYIYIYIFLHFIFCVHCVIVYTCAASVSSASRSAFVSRGLAAAMALVENHPIQWKHQLYIHMTIFHRYVNLTEVNHHQIIQSDLQSPIPSVPVIGNMGSTDLWLSDHRRISCDWFPYLYLYYIPISLFCLEPGPCSNSSMTAEPRRVHNGHLLSSKARFEVKNPAQNRRK